MHDGPPRVRGTGRTVLLLHGRGGSAEDLLAFAAERLPAARYVALQADGGVWYPQSFLAPRERNEPHLSAALEAVRRAIADAPTEDIVIGGFSQGACLAAEFAARNPGRYGGILVFSGGLIGKDPLPPDGSLEGTPVIIGCSENDPFIPLARAEETARLFRQAGADVTLHTYPGSTHTITSRETELARRLLRGSAAE